MTTWREKARHRNFQLWEFHAGHGCLLIRSPKGPDGGADAATNLDLLCFDVAYAESPRFLAGLEIAEPTRLEAAGVAGKIGARMEGKTLRILVSGTHRYAIVAAQFVEQEHDKGVMTSPFSPIRTPRRSPA